VIHEGLKTWGGTGKESKNARRGDTAEARAPPGPKKNPTKAGGGSTPKNIPVWGRKRDRGERPRAEGGVEETEECGGRCGTKSESPMEAPGGVPAGNPQGLRCVPQTNRSPPQKVSKGEGKLFVWGTRGRRGGEGGGLFGAGSTVVLSVGPRRLCPREGGRPPESKTESPARKFFQGLWWVAGSFPLNMWGPQQGPPPGGPNPR